jgi:hypothetical protein
MKVPTMLRKTSTALLIGLALSGVAQAQSGCPCDASATLISGAALPALLGNKMVCGNVGGEQWQEWHNGSSSGPVVDYKRGPGHSVDPSTTVGTYAVSGNTVTYTYGSQSYTYAVCLGNTGRYVFCGAEFGGRNITGVRVGGSGLQSCTGVP